MSVRGRSISGIRALSAVCFTRLSHSLPALPLAHCRTFDVEETVTQLLSASPGLVRFRRTEGLKKCAETSHLVAAADMEKWKTCCGSGSSTSSLSRSHWELACSNGGLSQIAPLKLFVPLVFVPSTSENKDASFYSKWIWEIVYFYLFFISRALRCSLETPTVLNRLILLFLTHLGILVKPLSTWRNIGRKYSNVQSVPLAHISEAVPHSNRWTYVSQSKLIELKDVCANCANNRLETRKNERISAYNFRMRGDMLSGF